MSIFQCRRLYKRTDLIVFAAIWKSMRESDWMYKPKPNGGAASSLNFIRYEFMMGADTHTTPSISDFLSLFILFFFYSCWCLLFVATPIQTHFPKQKWKKTQNYQSNWRCQPSSRIAKGHIFSAFRVAKCSRNGKWSMTEKQRNLCVLHLNIRFSSLSPPPFGGV